jgi:hypothetical protein
MIKVGTGCLGGGFIIPERANYTSSNATGTLSGLIIKLNNEI